MLSTQLLTQLANDIRPIAGQIDHQIIDAACSFEGVEPFRGHLSRAKLGDQNAVDRVKLLITAAKANVLFLEFQLTSSIERVIELLRSQGYERLQQLSISMLDGDLNAGRILRDLFDKLDDEFPLEGADQQDQPLHHTPLAPPSASSSQVPLTGSSYPNARRVDSTGGPRAAARPVPARAQAPAPSPASRGSVTPLHGQQRQDDNESAYDPHEHRPERHHQDPGQEPARKYDQVVVYGRDTALQADISPTQDKQSKTINIKAAKAKGASTTGGVDWANGIVMMLTPHEISVIAAVLMGYIPECRFAGHGPKKDKWLTLQHTDGDWEGSVRFSVAQGSGQNADQRKVAIGPTDIDRFASIFIRAATITLQCDPMHTLALIRRAGEMYALASAAKQRRDGQRGQGGQGQGQRQRQA